MTLQSEELIPLKTKKKDPVFTLSLGKKPPLSELLSKKRSTADLDCSYGNYDYEGDVERRNQYLVYLKLNLRVKLSSSTAALVLSGVPERAGNGFMSSKHNIRCHLCLYNSVQSTWCHLQRAVKQ